MKQLGWIPLFLIVLAGAGVGTAIDAFLNLGDTFYGDISPPGDVDVLQFDAVAGTRVSVEVEAEEVDNDDDDDDDSQGSDDDDDQGSDDDDDDDRGIGASESGSSNLHPRIQIIDLTTGETLADVASGGDKTKIKKLPLPSTGCYQILISGDDGTTGPYVAETDRKLGNDVLKFSSTSEVAGGTTLSVTFDALTGFELEKATFKAMSPALVDNPALFAPSGKSISLTGLVDIDDDLDEVEIEDVLLPEMGTYTLTIDNVGGTGKIKTKIRLEEDDVDEQDIYEDP